MTLRQACEELTPTQNAYGDTDLKRSINKALRALMGLHPLKCFRRVYRFVSAGPRLVLPQGCAGLVRACVNGRPVTMRGQDFKFLLSGPGDMERPPFRPVPTDNIYDLGFKPIMVEPHFPFRVYTLVDGSADQPAIVVRGYGPDGKEVIARPVPYSRDAVISGDVTPEPEAPVFTEITAVTIPSEATRYITLCAFDDISKDSWSIALYNPREHTPQFRHYELMGWPEDQPVEVLAEVRMGHIDVVDDEDVLIVDSVEPIEWMIRADWEMKAGETQKASIYRSEAEKWLRRCEATNDTVQTKIIINSEYYGSPGEVSDDAFNV